MMHASPLAAASPAVATIDAAVDDSNHPDIGHRQPRLMFVASDPDHLEQLLSLRNWWASRDRTWVAPDEAATRSSLAGEHVTWTSARSVNPLTMWRLARRTVRDQQPDVVVTTGTGAALAFAIVARSRSIDVVEVEFRDQSATNSVSGRMCRRLASQFLVQWPEPTEVYPNSADVVPGGAATAW